MLFITVVAGPKWLNRHQVRACFELFLKSVKLLFTIGYLDQRLIYKKTRDTKRSDPPLPKTFCFTNPPPPSPPTTSWVQLPTLPFLLLIGLYKVGLTFVSMRNEIVKCDHSNGSYCVVLSCGAVYYMLYKVVLSF